MRSGSHVGCFVMDIGFIYCKKDPQQAETKEFLCRYVRERGILARIVETDRKVTSPTLIINGRSLAESRAAKKKQRRGRSALPPSPRLIAEALDAFIWSV